MPNEFANQRLRLKDGCLFFKIDGPNAPTKGFLINISSSSPPGQNWWLDSEAGIMILDLLVRKGASNENNENGIHYRDLKKHLMRRYKLQDTSEEEKGTRNNVNKSLKKFLTELRDDYGVLELLGSSATGPDVDDDNYPELPEPHPEYPDPVINVASTLFCCGYVVTRYRP
jgi:hypothetical protein